MRRILFLIVCCTCWSFGQTSPVSPSLVLLTSEHSFLQTNSSHEELFQMQSPIEGKKNVTLAVTLSLLLPGLGELYVGDYTLGKYLSIAEGGLWISYASFQLYGGWVQDDARSYAGQHAGLATIDKSDQYFIDIGNFKNVDEFNNQMLLDRDPEKIYDPNSANQWNWDTDANRENFRQLRVSSDAAFNNSHFILAAIGVNHLISAINAGRLASKHNKSLEETGSLNFNANVLGTITNPQGIMVTATLKF